MIQQEDSEKVLGFLDGTLPREEREEFLDRMREEPALRAELESLQALARTLETMPEETPPAGFAAGFCRAHSGGLLERLKSFWEALPAPAVPALALAGAAAGALVFFSSGGGGGVEPLPLAGCTLIATGGDASVNGEALAGNRTELRLQDRIRVDADFEGALHYTDGTRIRIRPGSELQVRSRGLFLREGKVWLSVTRDLRGFKVETPLAMAAVKGTEFWVEVGDVMKVAVTEGLVAVISDVGEKLLSAGKAALVGVDHEIAVHLLEDGRHPMFRDAEEGDFGLER